MPKKVMFEVHPAPFPGGNEAWASALYRTGDGGFDMIAWFADKEDAEFARQAFEKREGEQNNG